MSNKTRLDVLLVERGFGADAPEGAGDHHGRAASLSPASGRTSPAPPSRTKRSHRGARPHAALRQPRRAEAGEGDADLSHHARGKDLRRHRRVDRAALPTVCCKTARGSVYAVDVGYGQLDWKLRSDERVVCLERTNARYLSTGADPGAAGLRVDRRVVHLAEADLPGALSAAARGGRDRLPDQAAVRGRAREGRQKGRRPGSGGAFGGAAAVPARMQRKATLQFLESHTLPSADRRGTSNIWAF